MKNKIFILLTSLMVMLLPTNFVLAEETDVADLLKIVEQLRTRIIEIQTQITQIGNEVPTTKSEIIQIKAGLKFTKTLRRGTHGNEVEDLQTFLAQYPDIYPEGLITGYFGELTEKAVQKWQEKNNVISFGNVDTTGYGQVGPKTRKELNAKIQELIAISDNPGKVPQELPHAEVIQKEPSITIPEKPVIIPVITPTEDTEELCSDMIDNDNDDLIDLNDLDCFAFVSTSMVTNIKVYDVSSDRVYIDWKTDIATNSLIEYGILPLNSITPERILIEENRKNHSIKIENLLKATIYYYRIADGNGVFSDQKTFTTYDTMTYDYEVATTTIFGQPYSIAYNSNNDHLYIWLSNSKLLVETDLLGNVITELGTDTSSGGLSHNPNKNVLYSVTGSLNDRPVVREKNIFTGETLRTFSALDYKPDGITYDYDENVIYVVNPNSDYITKMNTDGEVISRQYVSSILPKMVGIAYNDIDGNLMIYDYSLGVIKILRKDGTVVKSIDFKNLGLDYTKIRDIAFNPTNKHIFVASPSNDFFAELIPTTL